jgi:hypothetical protein
MPTCEANQLTMQFFSLVWCGCYAYINDGYCMGSMFALRCHCGFVVPRTVGESLLTQLASLDGEVCVLGSFAYRLVWAWCVCPQMGHAALLAFQWRCGSGLVLLVKELIKYSVICSLELTWCKIGWTALLDAVRPTVVHGSVSSDGVFVGWELP